MQTTSVSTSINSIDLPESIRFKCLALDIVNKILSNIPNDENIFARSNLKKLKVEMMYFPPEVFDRFFWNTLYMICKEYITDFNKPYTSIIFEIYRENLEKYNYYNNTFLKEYNKIISEKRIHLKEKLS